MKHSLLLAFCLFAFTTGSAFTAQAASGDYVCKSSDIPGSSDVDAKNVARTLNSLKCDNSKPITTMADNRDDTAVIVCCVSK